MNWDAIGAIAELLGAIGVIASLVYLATQIRQSREQMIQNNRTTRSAAYQHFDQSLQDAFFHVLSVPEMGRVVRQGAASYDVLDEEDAYLYSMWMGGMMTRFDNAYYQFRTGMIDEERWETLLRMIRGMVQSPGYEEWWRRTKHPNLSTKFIALVDEILGEEPEAATSATAR
ncbi:MAG: hypothetical protein JRF61_06455 [Deltaproteobacteria bacterium]|jgi:hypothetical protein|nr:hypothetical protein [Deltaproteobacteria bacterium]